MHSSFFVCSCTLVSLLEMKIKEWEWGQNKTKLTDNLTKSTLLINSSEVVAPDNI